jgi:hypothetical protein
MAFHTLRTVGLTADRVDNLFGKAIGPNRVPVGVLSRRIYEDVPPGHRPYDVNICDSGGAKGDVICFFVG